MPPKLDYRLLTHSPQENRTRFELELIINQTLYSVDPGNAVKNHIKFIGEDLIIGESSYQITGSNNIHLVAIGKAAIPMMEAAQQILGERIKRGIVVTKALTAHSIVDLHILILRGDHPVPGESSLCAAEEVLAFLSDLKCEDIVIFLISGGGSALISKPAQGLSIQDLQEVTRSLLNASVPIQEINKIRKHLDVVKGGGLLKAAMPAKVITVALSDVVGNDPGIIASGPSVPDPSTYEDCMEIIEQHQLEDLFSRKLMKYFLKGINGSLPETIKPEQVDASLHKEIIVGSVDTAMQKILSIGKELGYRTVRSAEYLGGDIEYETIRVISEFQTELTKFENEKLLMVWGGEVTVYRTGSNKGGRNMQMALMLAGYISNNKGVTGIALATDGEDGSTEAAGAIIDSSTIERAYKAGFDYEMSVTKQAAFDYFEALDDLIITGSTGTNVNDLIILIMN
jgi:hydroxypyruvate reductase